MLAKSLWSLDLSLTYVADHARAGTSGLYRLSGLWGGASGSLLMFTAMVAAAVAALVWTQPPTRARSAALWGSLSVAVLAGAVLSTANPFRRLAIPAIEGAGLQPILEHPAMLYHPPLLYLGQVSTIVPFLVAVAAPLGPRERRALRGWLGLSLALLTAGLATGSNWAYVELGWGGFWGWDPVENGILVAWLLVLAAMHALGQPGHGRAIRILCGLPWILVLVAASVTRGGVGGSVHAFADDERVSWVLTGLVVATAVVVALATGDQPSGPHQHRWLRITCAALASAAALVVLAGVLYPIPARGEPLVTGPYYATLLAPLAIVGLGATATVVGGRATVWSASGALAGVIAAAAAGTRSPFALCVAAGVGATLVNMVDGLRPRARRRWPMRVGHIGFAVLLIGVAGSTQADRVTVGLDVGEEIEVGGRSFRHVGVEVVEAPERGSSAVVATVEVSEGGDHRGRAASRLGGVPGPPRAARGDSPALPSGSRRSSGAPERDRRRRRAVRPVGRATGHVGVVGVRAPGRRRADGRNRRHDEPCTASGHRPTAPGPSRIRRVRRRRPGPDRNGLRAGLTHPRPEPHTPGTQAGQRIGDLTAWPAAHTPPARRQVSGSAT